MAHLRTVPLNLAWITTKGPSGAPLLDIHAIYRRPAVDHHYGDAAEDADETLEASYLRDPHGFMEWDTTTPLPLQHHQRWTARGFVYVTLADERSLGAVAKPELAESGIVPLRNAQEFVQNRRTNGPWVARLYLRDLAEARAAEAESLLRDIAEYGAERAELLVQQRTGDTEYRIPERWREPLEAPAEPAAMAATPTVAPAPDGLSISEKQALARARRKVAAGKTLTDLETAVLETVDGVAA